ncbi:MAG: CRTAC1 family protein [Planctomyces sp.]|nr:CRTAC1 family protein [Planctomyces sp.]
MADHSRNPKQAETQSEDYQDDRVVGKAVQFSIVVILLLAVGGGLFWYMTRPPADQPVEAVEQSPLPEERELPPLTIPNLPFTDVTQASGIDFVHENGATGEKLLPETMGGGGAFFDFDGDGDQDILFINSMEWPWTTPQPEISSTSQLYANDGKGTFTNVTKGSGLDTPLYGNGVACGDYDNDGKVDVFITTVGQNRLFHNDGGGRFTETTSSSGVGGPENAWSTSAGWFDYDNDGDLDLFVCNYIEWTREQDQAMGWTLKGGQRAYGRPTDFTGASPFLYRNNGDSTFSDVSKEAGIQVVNPDTGSPLAKSLGLTFADVNADGRLDVLVANDTVQNLLFLSQPDGTFAESGALSGVAFDNAGGARGAMGVDVAWFRNTKSLGFVIGNFATEMTALYVCQNPGMTMPLFRDEAVSNGIGPATRVELTFGVLFVDIDQDGRQDLFSCNGHLEQEINSVQESQHYEQPPQLLWNCGADYETEFMPVPTEKCGEEFTRRMVGRGASYADIDSDGDLDLLLFASGSKPRLLRNDQQLGNHWLRVRLEGQKCNRDAIGAIVKVTLPGGEVLTRIVNPTRSYQSQVELPVHFGLGSTAQVESIDITWPDGSSQSLGTTPANQLLTIRQQ